MNSPEQTLVLVPAYLEQDRVGSVVRGAKTHLPVLVVDDGSPDETARRARAAGAEVIVRERNGGKGAALKTGLGYALERGWDAVLTMDADGQHDPAEIPAFLSARATTSADLVVGARDFRRMPPQRILTNTVARWIFSWAVGRRIADNQSGYRLMSRRLIEAVLDSPEQGFAFEVDVIAECIGRDWTISWIPIRTIYAGEGSHIRPWDHLTSFLRVVRRARSRVGRVQETHTVRE